MDSLIKQMRGRYSSVGQEQSYSGKDRRIPPQRTQSFKTEKKRDQNWLQWQFSRNMSQDYDSENLMEHATAVAAAAYAIKSLEDSPMPDQRKTIGASDSFLTRLRSKKEDTSFQAPERGRVSKRFSGDIASTSSVTPDGIVPVTAAAEEKKTGRAPTIKKNSTFANEDLNNTIMATKSRRPPESVTDPAPSMKRAPTFSNGGKPEGVVPKPDMPPVKLTSATSRPDVNPPTMGHPAPPSETRRRNSRRPGTNDVHADAWEKAEMEKIKERYEKLNATIQSWEDKKKKKARSKLDKRESQSERRRARALQKYHSEMETIEQIAGGARAQAEDKRRKEESKARDKAKIIRNTGKLPATCFCF